MLLKNTRYYWWLLVAYFQKHLLMLLGGLVLGFVVILGFTQLTPKLSSKFLYKNEVIGMTGSYYPHTLPDEIRFLYTSPLIKLAADGELIPLLINSYETLDDQKRFRIHLKTNLIWSDKKPFVASDINFTIGGVKMNIIDKYTIDFILEKPLATFPVLLTRPLMRTAFVGIGGTHLVNKYVFNKNGYLESISLLPNKNTQPAKIYRFYSNEEDLVAAYKMGRIKSFTTSDRMVFEELRSWKNTKIKREESFGQIMTLFFNNATSFFQARENRRALAQLVPNLVGFGVPAQGPIPPSSWAFNQDVKHLGPNTQRAMATLDSETLASVSAPLVFYTFYENREVASMIKAAFTQAGIKVDLKLTPVTPNEYDMLLAIWNPPIDPDQYFFWHSAQKNTNFTQFSNAKVDLLLEEGRKVVTTQQRKLIYRDFQKALVDEVPAHFLYYPYRYKIERR